jgi:hypothetical protein
MSMYLLNGSPTSCKFCGNPFPIKDGHKEAFHSTQTNGYFCDVFCAQDELSAYAAASKKHKARLA